MQKPVSFLLLAFLATLGFLHAGAQAKWRLAVQMWTFNKSSFVEGIEKADSCGFRYIEAYPGQKLGGEFRGEMGPSMTQAERIKLKEFLKKKNIVFLAYGVADGNDETRTDQDWRNCFEFAKEMGVEEITAMPTPSQLDLVNELAGSYHIRVAIHNEPGKTPYSHPDSVLNAIRNRPNLGACVDIGNWVRNGVNIVDCLKNQLKGRVYSLHLKDVQQSAVPRSPETILGQGSIDVPAILNELKNQGFVGFFSIEHSFRGPANLSSIRQDIQYFHLQVSKL
ncbi:MAG: sugar phosphate isomerase/epimerase family protein [Chitinophagales bacterium]